MKFIKILGFLVLSIFQINAFGQERYPSNNTLTDINPNAVCKCDANNDPCCIPPVGTSSNKVDEAPNKQLGDTAKCKCDPTNDPCCKKMEGTKK